MAFYELDPEVSPRAADMDSGVLNKLTTLFRTEAEAGKLFSGAQLAVYRYGQCVLDIGGGFARASDRKHVTPETMFVLYSSTKGLAALNKHQLHEPCRFAYEHREQ